MVKKVEKTAQDRFSLVRFCLWILLLFCQNDCSSMSAATAHIISRLPFLHLSSSISFFSLASPFSSMRYFSLVRFRSVPGSAMDICAIFLSMAVGLATGTNHLALALMLAVCVSLLNIIYTLLPIGKKKSGHKDLSITIPESLDYTEVFDDIFEKYLSECELVSVKTTNMGSLFKL